MIKRIILLRRKPGMSREEFKDYWVNNHAKTVGSFPEVKKYTVNYFTSTDDNIPFDGVAELWFEDEEAMKQHAEMPARRKFVQEDNPRFQDLERRFGDAVEEYIIK